MSITITPFNCLATKRPDLIKYFIDISETNKLTPGSNRKIELRCPDCGHKKFMKINALSIRGFSCNFCSDGVSLPEKFILTLLKALNFNFETQFQPTWSMKKRYDFYVLDFNLIIEAHGNQHYNSGFTDIDGAMTLEQQKKNDELKRKNAKNNGFEYVEIDCRRSSFAWLRDNTAEQLSKYFDFSEVDWASIYEKSQNSLCIEAWKLWNEGIRSTVKIGEQLKINRNTISAYLKRGAEIKKVDYDPTDPLLNKMSENAIKNISKVVNQYSLSGEFICRWSSVSEANRQLGILSSCISSCANNKKNSAGGFLWRYSADECPISPLVKKTTAKSINQYSLSGDFLREWDSAKEIERKLGIDAARISSCALKQTRLASGFIWRFTTDKSPVEPLIKTKRVNQYSLSGKFLKRWISVNEASKQLNIGESSISSCANNKRKSAGKFIWKYIDDSNSICDIKKISVRPDAKPINQYSLSGEFIREWGSTKESEKNTGVPSSSIYYCAKGKRESAGGFIWRFVNEPL